MLSPPSALTRSTAALPGQKERRREGEGEEWRYVGGGDVREEGYTCSGQERVGGNEDGGRREIQGGQGDRRAEGT